MRRAFVAEIEFPERADVLDVGCGTGVLTRALARVPNVDAVVGVDVAPSLVGRARELASDLTNVAFEVADGRSLPFESESFDVVVFDSTLSHVPSPEAALAEASRVLRPGGSLAAFDGDYATTTVALGDHDPLQTCVDAMMANSVNDRWVMRRLPAMLRTCGFEATRPRSYGYVETSDAAYMLTIVDRGADILRDAGQVGPEVAQELKADARRRVEAGRFFGFISYSSLIGRRA
jgi:ubiquinone/menaquinone biosynthesis C-methylase UbiE